MASWDDCPSEIRLSILENLLQDGCSVAKFATVSREWQAIIERHNFSRIKVTESRLYDFTSNTDRNRHLVNYIWLCLELESYCICSLHHPSDRFLSESDVDRVFWPVQVLLSWLQTWEPNGKLVLDISVHSPGDSASLLNYLTFEPDIVPEDGHSPASASLDLGDPGIEQAALVWTVCRRSVEGKRAIVKTLNTMNIIDHEATIDDETDMKNLRRLPSTLPSVPAVTEYASLFKSLAFQNVRKLVVFEASNSYYKRVVPGLRGRSWSSRDDLSVALAENCHGLEEISASFLVEAASYFSYRLPGWKWYRLESLTLTSELLTPREPRSTIDRMLLKAAAAARDMPALQTMELWNGRAGLAALFRYQRKYTAVIWRGTWRFTLRPRIIQAWEDVACEHETRGLVVRTELLDCGADIKSYGDAIYYLRLSKQVIRPISLHQIRTEHNVHYAWEEVRRRKEHPTEVGDEEMEAEETDGGDVDSEDWDNEEWENEAWDGDEPDEEEE